ncbi:Fe-S cluster assembly protein HesB [Spongiactinospora gelatinilytica]|uniref:Fe-S cluster assembly protein HesB n=1 Tax=Spongiactinospora gelatinilytica TaxID=2666298 RepID=A0A2W2GI67_9ACTN|nr:Fe-S cluster assembly protein HesB [Spongiactinospora gelatinilytica]PZG47563.1 Fe-S cluster assembly protein HesB [Spongiactinospora gelatinilytica]
MLALTDTAVTAIRDLMVGEDLPADAGLRITLKSGDDASLELSLASAPRPGDQVIEKSQARVFLDPAAAELLSDRSLDADVPPTGHPVFRLPRRSGAG